MDQLCDFHYFKYAQPGTEEKKFWNWAVETFGEEEIMTVPTPLTFIDVGFQVANQKRAFFSSVDVRRASLSTMCKLLSQKAEDLKLVHRTLRVLGVQKMNKMAFQAYIHFGDNMKWMTKQIILYERSKYAKPFIKTKTLVMEHGHIVYIRREIQRTNMLGQFQIIQNFIGKVDPSRRIVTEKCLSSQPQDEERTAHEMSVVTFFSLRALIKMFFSFSFVAFLVLAFETFVSQIKGSMPKAQGEEDEKGPRRSSP